MIDLVMWAKNGERTLPAVLQQIDRVIPIAVVHKKIMIDDHSTDNTKQIGLDHGWVVLTNKGRGLCSAANSALKNVETPIFCSFEQDLFLSNDWFSKVYPLIFQENVMLASGVRFASAPSAVRSLELLEHRRVLEAVSKGSREKTFYGQTADNTVYRTDFLKRLGGFDYFRSNGGIDYSLSLKVLKTQRVWAVNYNVVSLHLRPNSYRFELKHQRWYGRFFREAYTLNKLPMPGFMTTKTFLKRFLMSPLNSLIYVKKRKDPSIFYYYPLFCLAQLIGLIEGKRF